jgi:hypothetical protein
VQHGRLEVVDHQTLRHAAEMGEGIFQTTNEIFRCLAEGRFAVTFAAVTQDDPKDMRPAPLPVGTDDRRAGAEVDLRLLAGCDFHAP